jgi:uncharacterized protein
LVLRGFFRQINYSLGQGEFMSSKSNQLIMQEIFDGVAKGDGRKFYEYVADHATMEVTGDYSWGRIFHGKQSINRDLYGYVRSLLGPEGNRTHAFNFISGGQWVVVEARGDMVTKDGVPYRNHYCLLYRFEEGKIVEMKEYQDSAMCERILGPFPKPASASS